ncbi:hypothetical protein NDU88_001068 [Pleurodeles waltl]|uniref:Uncharacterized protein n=1 Tax=Pleurodeles waltl TaxID=8319 RepID=A0AAV7V8K6_PLEWA|nr:hypothetical protein NDU88_001068 [Pleurodeles waltl]
MLWGALPPPRDKKEERKGIPQPFGSVVGCCGIAANGIQDGRRSVKAETLTGERALGCRRARNPSGLLCRAEPRLRSASEAAPGLAQQKPAERRVAMPGTGSCRDTRAGTRVSERARGEVEYRGGHTGSQE